MNARWLVLGCFILAGGVSPAANAADFSHSDNLTTCSNVDESADLRIKACTNAIYLGGLSRNEIMGVLQNLGAAYLENKDYAHAIPAFNDAIKYAPKMWQAYVNRSSAFVQMGEFEHAVADIDQAKTIIPDSAAVLNLACGTRAGWGQQLDTALADCNRSLQIRPNFASTLSNRALVYFRLQNFAAAVVDADAAISLKPEFLAFPLYVRGLAKLRNGDASGGNADLVAAKSADPAIEETFAGYGLKQ